MATAILRKLEGENFREMDEASLAVERTLLRSSLPAKAVAAKAGLSYGYLMKAKNPDYRALQFQFRHAAPLMNAAGNYELLHWLARQCQHACFPLPTAHPDQQEIFGHAAHLVKETGDVLTDLHAALQDQTITPDEAGRIVAQCHEAISALGTVAEAVTRIAARPKA